MMNTILNDQIISFIYMRNIANHHCYCKGFQKTSIRPCQKVQTTMKVHVSRNFHFPWLKYLLSTPLRLLFIMFSNGSRVLQEMSLVKEFSPRFETFSFDCNCCTYRNFPFGFVGILSFPSTIGWSWAICCSIWRVSTSVFQKNGNGARECY